MTTKGGGGQNTQNFDHVVYGWPFLNIFKNIPENISQYIEDYNSHPNNVVRKSCHETLKWRRQNWQTQNWGQCKYPSFVDIIERAKYYSENTIHTDHEVDFSC